MFDAVTALKDDGSSVFRPGDLTAHLRDNGTPFGSWEVRGELTNLERLGLVALDDETATWQLVNGASFSVVEAKSVQKTG